MTRCMATWVVLRNWYVLQFCLFRGFVTEVFQTGFVLTIDIGLFAIAYQRPHVLYSEISFFQVLLREAYEEIRASCIGLMQTIMEIKAGLQGMNLNVSITCETHLMIYMENGLEHIFDYGNRSRASDSKLIVESSCNRLRNIETGSREGLG